MLAPWCGGNFYSLANSDLQVEVNFAKKIGFFFFWYRRVVTLDGYKNCPKDQEKRILERSPKYNHPSAKTNR